MQSFRAALCSVASSNCNGKVAFGTFSSFFFWDSPLIVPVEIDSIGVKVKLKLTCKSSESVFRHHTLKIPLLNPRGRIRHSKKVKGWYPTRYGVPEEIASQVDPITVYAVCCVRQALLSACIEDPFRLHRHIYVSDLSNCLGTRAGGMRARIAPCFPTNIPGLSSAKRHYLGVIQQCTWGTCCTRWRPESGRHLFCVLRLKTDRPILLGNSPKVAAEIQYIPRQWD